MTQGPITVVGAGAIGGFAGARLLAAGHDVRFVEANREHVAAIRSGGLHVTGAVSMDVRPGIALPHELDWPLGPVLLAVKARDTVAALEPVVRRLAADGFVVSLQNGLEEYRIAAAVGVGRTIGASLTFGGTYEAPGSVSYAGPGSFHLGELDGSMSGRLERLADLLSAVHPVEPTDRIFAHLWGKSALGAFYFATALVDADVLEILADDERLPSLGALVAEVARVAAVEGVVCEAVDGFDPQAFLDADEAGIRVAWEAQRRYWRGLAARRTGVWRDLWLHRRRTEVREILGPVLERARRHGVATPCLDRLFAEVEAAEAARAPEVRPRALTERRGQERIGAMSASVPGDVTRLRSAGRGRARLVVALACGITAGLVALAGSPAAAPPPSAAAKGKARGHLGLVGVDHVGLTVPDVDEAVEWFQDVMGCSAPLSFGPFGDPTGTFMQDLLGVHPRSVIGKITLVRCGRSANIELFEYDAPDQDRTVPKNSDWAGHHVAFYVTDIDAAIAYMQSRGVEKLLGPLPVTDGPAAGQSINYFRAPFGTYIELISYPAGMAYERDPGRPLWSPKRNGRDPVETTVPGLLGVDHVGITVPSVSEAAEWFEDVLGCFSPLAFGPFGDPTGTFMQDLLGVHPRAVIEEIRLVRCGNGPSIELFQYTSPDQNRTFRRNSDYGGKHIAFYVRHIEKAVAYMESRGVEKLLGPFAVTDGPAAGQSINYFRAPFGTYIELISYPKGMAYEATAATPLWDPRDNRP